MAMRTFGSTNGLSRFSPFRSAALAALFVGAVACGTTTTVIDRSQPGAPGGDGTTTDTEPTDPTTVGDPTDKEAPSPPLANGLAITEVAVFQAVKVPVVTDGKATSSASRSAPVVVNRPALIRVYVSPASSYKRSEVTAELRLVDGTTRLPIVKDTKTLDSDSTDEDIDSTFNFEVPGTSLPEGVTYQVLLTAKGGTVPEGSAANTARFPKDGGVQDLGAKASGKLKIVIVPVKYDFDGSGRTPDVSAAQLERYKNTFMAQYAASDVEVTARAPWSYTAAIKGNGAGFSEVLNAITNLRKTDKASSDVYYYGALAPTSSFNSFCAGGCVTGLSTVVESAKTSFLRASVGVGFPGQDSVNTAAHEVGHAHGREHAPCGGAQGVDPDFPHAGGFIGVWGYNLFTKKFISPTKGHDFMSYCENEWVSDYTFSALFDRIAAVNGGVTTTTGSATGSGSGQAQAFASPQTFRMATVAADGSVSWGGDFDLDEEPAGGQARTATFASASGVEMGTHTARFYPYDHLPGGVLMVPPAPKTSMLITKARIVPTWSSVRISGLTNALAR